MKREEYEASLKTYRDNKNTMDYATELATLEGCKEGLKEGEMKGKLEGKIEMIRGMIKAQIPFDKIIEISGLSKEEIEDLIKE